MSQIEFNPGDVVFFKSVKKSSHRKAPVGTFKGFGFGVMLGHVPPFAKDPPEDQLIRLLGAIGFVSLDDVGELISPEAQAQLIAKFEEKYYTKVNADAEASLAAETPAEGSEPVPIMQPQPTTLIDSRGNPILSNEPEATP